MTPACGPWAAAPRLVHTSHRTDQLARSSPNCLRHPGRRGRLRGPAAGGGGLAGGRSAPALAPSPDQRRRRRLRRPAAKRSPGRRPSAGRAMPRRSGPLQRQDSREPPWPLAALRCACCRACPPKCRRLRLLSRAAQPAPTPHWGNAGVAPATPGAPRKRRLLVLLCPRSWRRRTWGGRRSWVWSACARTR